MHHFNTEIGAAPFGEKIKTVSTHTTIVVMVTQHHRSKRKASANVSLN
jgi:hypothetical protein